MPNSRDLRGKQNEPLRISDAEWMVMKVIWRLQAATAKEIVAALEGAADWKPKTIHTLIARLARKGAVSVGKEGREHVFKPRITEQRSRLAASRSFLARVFDGQMAPFLACFLEHRKLTKKEIDELKAILEEKSP